MHIAYTALLATLGTVLAGCVHRSVSSKVSVGDEGIKAEGKFEDACKNHTHAKQIFDSYTQNFCPPDKTLTLLSGSDKCNFGVVKASYACR